MRGLKEHMEMATTTYIGFYRSTPDSPANAAWRDTGKLPPTLAKLVNEFPSKLPTTCKLIGSWGVGGGPSVIIVEAESYSDLQHIGFYYAGWLEFDWRPTTAIGRNN